MKKDTLVISAFPGSGKSYCTENNKHLGVMIDSDSSEFSWLKDREGRNTDVRNPDFPNNYMEHIKSNIGKVDVIFVSTHDVVREALAKNSIDTYIIYPKKSLKEDLIKRFKERGNNEGFIKFMSNNWDKFIEDLEEDAKKVECFTPYVLESKDEFIDGRLISRLKMLKGIY